MRVVFMGTPDFAVDSLTALIEAGYEVTAVITQPDKPRGRGEKISYSPVKAKALDLGLKILQPPKVKDSQFVAILKSLEPEVIVVTAFGQILSKEILDIPTYGCINVHASLLPKYRGAAPIHWAIIKGEKETGITTMLMDEGLDTGDMLLKASLPISPNATVGELHDKLSLLGGKVLIETLEKYTKGLLIPESQDNASATYAPLLKKEHERINWEQEAQKIHNLVRGMNPWPGAYTFLENNRLKIRETSYTDDSLTWQKTKCGEIVKLDNQGFWVQTLDKPLLIKKLQPAGKKVMTAKDFINGYGIKLGQILGDIND